MKRTRLSIIVLLTLAIEACGPAKPIEGPPSTNAIPADNHSQAIEKTKKTRLHCDYNSGQCNPSIAMILMPSDGDVSFCSAFLVSDRIMATNSHCIPADLRIRLKESGSVACNDRIFTLFAAHENLPEEKFNCESIIDASSIQPGRVTADYAFFRLSTAPGRPSVEISTEGFRDGDPFQLVKVDPSHEAGGLEGTIRRVNCTAVIGSSMAPESVAETSPTVSLANCSITHGNSGSPIFDKEGRVRGIIQAQLDKDTELRRLRRERVNLIEGVIADLNFGTSFSCITGPSEIPALSGDSLSARCPDRTGPEHDPVQKQIRALRDQARNEMIRLTWNHEELFGWSLNNESGVLIPRPACTRDASEWKSRFRTRSERNRERSGAALYLPTWTLKKGLDRYLRVRFSLEYDRLGRYLQIYFSPRDVFATGGTFVEAREIGTGLNPDDEDGLQYRLSVPACDPRI